MIPSTIDDEKYPIALDESGRFQWQTIQVAEERDEIWDDWSLGLGETKRESGRGYFFSRGFDATARGALRLSPFFHNLNNTDLTIGYGYFMEGVETSGSTLTLDAYSTTKGSVAPASPTVAGTLTWEHTVASQDERVLVISAQLDNNTVGFSLTVTYGGIACTFLGGKAGAAGTDAQAAFWYLLDPPTGANDIVITNNDSATVAMVTGAVSLYGVNADTPFGTFVGATGTDGTPTVTVSTTSGEFVIGVAAIEGSETLTAGANETERWDDAQSTDVTGAGYTQAGSDGGVIAPTLDAKAGTEQWVAIAVPIKPASTTSRSVMHISDETKIGRYIYDPDSGITLSATDTTASGVAGRPAKMNGNWYCPMGTGASAQKLTGVTWADVTGTWEADHLATFQKGVTPTLARVNADTQNTVELNADTGDVTDTWTNESEAVGDVTTKVTDMVEAEGMLMVAKEDGLFRFGSEAESFPVIPFLDRGKIDADNGKGLDAFGDEVVYPSSGNLWRHKLGGGSLPIGVNTIEGWRKVGAIPTPKDGRHVFEIHVEGYRYTLLNDGQESHLLQRRGGSNVFHSVLTIPLSKGMGVDSKKRLWIKGASSDAGTRDIRVIQLADDGSLDVENRKGQASGTHDIYFDERNPGRPQDQVQLRRFTVESEGDWDATTVLTLAVWRDNNTSPEAVGSAVTAAGVTTRNWTIGTNDTCYRFRPQLRVSTSSSYTPKNSQPDILRVIVGIRFPEIIRIVVNAEPEALEAVGMTLNEAEQNLRRLQNQGVVTFRREGDYDDPSAGTDLVTDRTFQGEIEGVTDITFKTSGGYARGLELRVRRFITV